MLGTIKVGHAGDTDALTGCTVFLPPEGTVGSCEVRGGAPGTRETQLLRPMFSVAEVNAVLLAGGSAFGLGAAQGVVRFLEERGIGYPTPSGPVPIVSAAVIYDLDFGDGGLRPDPEMAYRACCEARIDEESEGQVGAGMGATVGNAAGRALSTKGGFGLYRFQGERFRLEVAAVVNSFGDVVDDAGRIIAGVRDSSGGWAGAEKMICKAVDIAPFGTRESTTLVVIATDAALDSTMAARVALQGHNGIARAVRPSHTRYDGDTVFVLATGRVDVLQDAVEVLAARGTAEAIRSAVLRAEGAGGVPAARDMTGP